MDAPEAIAMTISAVCNGFNGVMIIDEVIPAAVIMATVEDPCKILTVAAAKNPKSRGLKPILEK